LHYDRRYFKLDAAAIVLILMLLALKITVYCNFEHLHEFVFVKVWVNQHVGVAAGYVCIYTPQNQAK